ncbi:MAG TPA: ABC transporter substrate-binding protein [Candidatus Methylacidiphilales bacterium]
MPWISRSCSTLNRGEIRRLLSRTHGCPAPRWPQASVVRWYIPCFEIGLRYLIFLGLFLGAAVLPLIATDDSGLRKVSLRLDWYPQAENGGYFCALAEGYYRKAGLDVQIIPALTKATVEPAVALGKSEFGLSTTDRVLMARSHNLPIVAVLASMEHDPTAIMFHAESPIKDFPDLEGHVIAAPPGVAWLPYLVRRYHFQHVGETPHSFENATFMRSPDYIEEILVTAEPYFMELNKVKVRWLLIMDSGCDPYHTLITSESLIARDPALVRAFVTASREGWRHYLVDPKAADAEIIRENPEMTQGQLDFSRQALIDGHFVDGFAARHEDVGVITEQRFESQYQLLRSIGLLDHDFDFRPAFTTDFLTSFAVPSNH